MVTSDTAASCERFFGTWILDVQSCRYQQGEPPQSGRYHIAADGDDVAVAWFTGANDVGAVKVAFSDNAAQSFGTPVRIDLGNPIGRVDLELLDDGTALVSWVEWVDGNEVLYLCQTDGGTGCIARQLLATNSAGASINFPRMARLGREIFVAWTQPTAAGDSLALRRLVLAGAD